jgi:hypothetical protein
MNKKSNRNWEIASAFLAIGLCTFMAGIVTGRQTMRRGRPFAWEEGYRAGYSNVTAIAREQVDRQKHRLPPVANVEQLFLDGMTNNPYR